MVLAEATTRFRYSNAGATARYCKISNIMHMFAKWFDLIWSLTESVLVMNIVYVMKSKILESLSMRRILS